jgi:hypothetical protein
MQPMIVETTCNRLYLVRPTGNPNLAHVWFGIEVKRKGGAYVPKTKAREVLVRREGCRIVAEAA